MRGSDEGLASTNNPELGMFPPGQTVLPFDRNERTARADTALTVPETDPERIAYNLWREGRVDEAIQFLEREIVTERNRRHETALVPASGTDAVHVEPASDWRERHKTALSKADFNAFGAAVNTIDVTPTPADAIVAHGRSRSFRPAWIIGLLLVAGVGAAAATNLWNTRDRLFELAALPAPLSDVAKNVLPVPTDPAATEPESSASAASVDAGPDNNAVADVAPDAVDVDPDAVDVPPPETEVAEIPPPNPEALAQLPPPPAGAAPIPTAEPALEEAASVPPESELSESASTPPDEELSGGPETTASIEPNAEQTTVVLEPRLPRVRPEPPPEAVAVANAEEPAVPLVLGQPEGPLVIPEPEEQTADIGPDAVPIYRPNQLRIFGPVRRLAGAPRPVPLNDPSFYPALTPAEYQALLERRAWAEHYAQQRRLRASPRIITLP